MHEIIISPAITETTNIGSCERGTLIYYLSPAQGQVLGYITGHTDDGYAQALTYRVLGHMEHSTFASDSVVAVISGREYAEATIRISMHLTLTDQVGSERAQALADFMVEVRDRVLALDGR